MYIDARRERIQGRVPSPDLSYNDDSRDGLLVDSDGAGDVGVHEVNLPQHDVGLLSPAQLQGLPAHKKWIFNIRGKFRLAYCSSHDVRAWKGLMTATQPTTTMSTEQSVSGQTLFNGMAQHCLKSYFFHLEVSKCSMIYH